MGTAKYLLLILVLGGVLFFLPNKNAVAPTSSDLSKLPLAELQTPATTLLAVGDIMLSRNVGLKIDQTGNPDLPFEKTQDLLGSADIAFGNLECPLSDSKVPIREGLVFRCLTKYVPGLINAGFDVLSTANNHSFDQGAKNIDFTINYLKSQNILPVGTFPSAAPPREGEREGVIERNSIKFGFLAYSYSAFNDGKNTAHPQVATMNLDNLKSDILNLKSRGADIVIVSMHAGIEYTRKPTKKQIDFAHAAIDAGADAVIGHHPHWIQTVEVYPPPREEGPGEVSPYFLPLDGEGEGGVKKSHKGLIFYSLGNFVFDQMWSQETREGLAVKLNFKGKELKSAELVPVIIDNYCCPRLANETEKATILEKIKK